MNAVTVLVGALFPVAVFLLIVVVRQRRALRALREKQRLLEAMLDNAPDIISLTDEECREHYVNTPSVQRLGLDAADRAASPPEQAFPEGYVTWLREHGACHPAPCRYAGPLRRPDGSEVWLEATAAPARWEDADGAVRRGWTHCLRDESHAHAVEGVVRQQEMRLRRLFREQADGLLVVDSRGVIRFANDAAVRMFGETIPEDHPVQPLEGARFGTPAHEEACIASDAVICLLVENGRLHAEMRCSAIQWDGEPCALITLRDISDRLALEEALRRSEERYRAVAENTYDWEMLLAPDGAALFSSASCQRVSGYAPDDFMHDPELLESLVMEGDRQTWRTFLQLGSDSGLESLDFRLVRKDNEVRWISMACNKAFAVDGEFLGTRCSMRDVTTRKRMEMELRRQSLHDALTGLANRTLCLDRLQRAITRSRRRKTYIYAVVVIDLDRFKVVNESLGHAFGDEVLREAGRRLQSAVRSMDTVARIGSDEFALFLDDLSAPREAIAIVKRVRQALIAPYVQGEQDVQITASMGIVLSPVAEDITEAEHVLRNAAIALSRAKSLGRDTYKVFAERMLDQAVERLAMERDMRRGLERGEFSLVYQPCVRLEDRSLIGFEALIRWRHPEQGMISPGRFIPLAEESELILDIGRFVLEQATATAAAWAHAIPGAAAFTLSVNISGRQFSSTDLVEQVRSAIKRTGVEPRQLKLEITETAIMTDAETAVEKLRRLKALGMTLSIDDFGTGYSSMSYLQQFPLDNLKIDLSFIRLMEVSPENKEIVKAILTLAHTLKLEVVAEGVETPSQENALKALGCEYAQGYLFARPMEEPDARALLAEAARAAPPHAH